MVQSDGRSPGEPIN